MTGMPASGFQKTSWTLVRAAAGADLSADFREALATLCQISWRPVYAFIRRRGYEREQAKDLTQGFFALLIEKNYLFGTDSERGKFRSFLLTGVKYFLANEWDRSRAIKRGGRQLPVSIDLVEAEQWHKGAVADQETPESLFERRWAMSLLERVMMKLRKECL
jgi:RNA polymerase sigma-70 factor (ECF subfamily)